MQRGSTRIYDARASSCARRSTAAARGRVVALPQISPLVVRATIAAEDVRFHDHDGVSWRSVARGGAGRHARRFVSGASTLTVRSCGSSTLTAAASPASSAR
jgi:penicillin-binding protein 1C